MSTALPFRVGRDRVGSDERCEVGLVYQDVTAAALCRDLVHADEPPDEPGPDIEHYGYFVSGQ
jgi:hypothetical protein